uniref:Kinase superfamily protein isoform 1 n=1 Tax=Tetraselmis sp. GSL018 TaxID=582737 RepID=A0A061SJG3_9CHLO
MRGVHFPLEADGEGRVSRDAQQLIRGLLRHRPQHRLGAGGGEEIARHPGLSGP